jgi:hypothetical protein
MKTKESDEFKLPSQDFDLFKALEAIDRKDYGYWDQLSPEQQKKFVPFMMLKWVSMIKGSAKLQGYYIRSTDYHANKHFLSSEIVKHPKLQWLMLCASSPGLGKQFHQWLPHIRESVSRLKDSPKNSEIKDFYKKIYPNGSEDDYNEIASEFVKQHQRKKFLAEIYPGMKLDDIERLNELITDHDIENYKKDSGET